jgi:hypothetical protein
MSGDRRIAAGRFGGSTIVTIAIVVALGPTQATAQDAEPVRQMPTEEPPGRGPIFGFGPPDVGWDPTTTAEPGWTDQPVERPADQTYGSTAQSYDSDGRLIGGLQLYDEHLDPAEVGYADEVPDAHVVQKGDTLWDISGYYLHDPYQWPKLWSYNEHITNAHWIFPGDVIVLQDPSQRRTRVMDPAAEDLTRFGESEIPKRVRRETYMLDQVAYVEAEDFEVAMRVIGGGEAAVMLATLDTAYMSYDEKNPPVVGERLVIYAPREKVYDAKSKKVLGHIVQVMGEVDVTAVDAKAAGGVIASALNPVERGYRVGPLRRRFRRVEEVDATRSQVGRVVASVTTTGPVVLEEDRRRKRRQQRRVGERQMLAGEEQFVVVDLGRDSGIAVGNILEVVRKGDEYMPVRVVHTPYEEGWPRRVVAALLVMEVNAQTSLTVAVFSRREIERGDWVEMRGPRDRGAQGGDLGSGPRAEGRVQGRAGDGKVEGGAKVKLGK